MPDLTLCGNAWNCPIRHTCKRNAEHYTDKTPNQSWAFMGPAVDGKCKDRLDNSDWNPSPPLKKGA